MTKAAEKAQNPLDAYTKDVLSDLHSDYDDHYAETKDMFDFFSKSVASLPATEQKKEAEQLVKLFRLAETDRDLALLIGHFSINGSCPNPCAQTAHKKAELRAEGFCVKRVAAGSLIKSKVEAIVAATHPGRPSNILAACFLYRTSGYNK